MKYEEKLVQEINNPDGYLWWQDSTPLSSLDGVAEDFLVKNNIESRIAALFIYQQLSEEILKLIARYCDLIIRASLYPIKLTTTLNLDNKKFSEARGYIQNSIEFLNKSKLLSEIEKLNDLRNTYGHDLINNYSKVFSNTELSNLDDLYKSILSLFHSSTQWFYKEIKRLRQKQEIKDLIDKY